MNRHCTRQRDFLHRKKEKIKRGRAEKPAQKKLSAIRAAPIGVCSFQSDIAKKDSEQTAKENYFHRGQMANLFDENICKGKCER